MATTSVPQPEIVRQFLNEESFDGTLGELLNALEPQEKANLTLKQQAQMYLLLWEMDGHIAALRERACDGSSIRILNFMHRAVVELFGVDNLTDKAMDKARQMAADLPDRSERKKAINLMRAKRDSRLRKQGFTDEDIRLARSL